MYIGEKKILNDYNATWVAVPGFATVVSTLFSKISLIQTTENRQQRTTEGVSNDKKQKKGQVIEKALIVAGGIMSFANDTDNNTLFELVNFSQSELERLNDTLLLDRATLILNAGNDHAADILPLGVTAAILGELQTLITEYEIAVVGPRDLILDKKTATEQLVVLFADTDDLLKNNLDRLMLQFKTSNDDFFRKYFNGREVLDLGTQHTRLGGTITDNQGNPIGGAIISVEGTDLEEETDIEGTFLFKPFIPGDFVVTIEKEGFIDRTFDVHVAPGQHLVLDATMQGVVYAGPIGGNVIFNVFSPATPRFRAGVIILVKNTTTTPMVGGLVFYLANNPADAYGGSDGIVLLPGEEITHTVTEAEFRNYLNIQNQGPDAGTYEVSIP